jgi:antitoxin ParD1/3/4
MGGSLNVAMATSMNISLPENMKAFVDQQVETGGYGSASEYMRELVRRDQKDKAQAPLETLLLEGLDSGPPAPATQEFWAELRRELAARRTKKRS